MSDAIIRRCPRCGRKAHDGLLVQCPDCRVPFVFEEKPYAGLSPEQLGQVASQIFGSWKFWAFLIILVGAAAWSVVVVADRVIDMRAKKYLSTLEENTTNHIGAAFGQISNQIAQEFRQPRIKAAIEQVAREKAGDLFTNGVRPSLEAFQDAVDAANAQLVKSSNALVALEAQALAAQRRIPPPTPAPITPPPTPAVTTATPSVKAPPIAPAPPGVKLIYVNRSIAQTGSGYLLTVFFRKGVGAASGQVDMVAGIYKQTAKILNFAAMTSSPTTPAAYSDTADAAQLKFPVSDREAPTVVLELSGPTIVRFMSDSLDTDVTIPVAADKMPIAAPIGQ